MILVNIISISYIILPFIIKNTQLTDYIGYDNM